MVDLKGKPISLQNMAKDTGTTLCRSPVDGGTRRLEHRNRSGTHHTDAAQEQVSAQAPEIGVCRLTGMNEGASVHVIMHATGAMTEWPKVLPC